MTRIITVTLALFVLPLFFAEASAGPIGRVVATERSAAPLKSEELFLQARQCQQRAGPYATQTTAWLIPSCADIDR